jgi:hypothetical protein
MSVAKPQPLRGADLLLVHCSAIPDDRPAAFTRLEGLVGGEMAHLLVRALVGGTQGRRGSSSP